MCIRDRTSTAKQKSVQNEEDLISEIKERCKKANAIILAHYYQAPEIQEIADFIGD